MPPSDKAIRAPCSQGHRLASLVRQIGFSRFQLLRLMKGKERALSSLDALDAMQANMLDVLPQKASADVWQEDTASCGW